MAEMDSFPGRPESHSTIYAYEFIGVESHKDYIKVRYNVLKAKGKRQLNAGEDRNVMLRYKIPESIQRIAKQGEFDEFDLNLFFAAEDKGLDAHFKYEDYVQKWLDLIRQNSSN